MTTVELVLCVVWAAAFTVWCVALLADIVRFRRVVEQPPGLKLLRHEHNDLD